MNDISINQQPGSHRGAGAGPDRFGGTGSTLDDSTADLDDLGGLSRMGYFAVSKSLSIVQHGLSWFVMVYFA